MTRLVKDDPDSPGERRKKVVMKHSICKICRNVSEHVFNKMILFKYDVSFFKCSVCGFMQTEEPYWISEAYSSPLSATDTGLIMRPMNFSKVAESVIMKCCDPLGIFLDYGGGNGVFVRMMRDKGFDFYRYDKFADNLYAIGFDLQDVRDSKEPFELLTSIEVIEHFETPLEEISKMISISENVLFTTYVTDGISLSSLKEWWYLGEYNGQHISFYSIKSLQLIAEMQGCYFYTNNVDTHMFTRKKKRNLKFSQTYNLNFGHMIKNKLVHGIDRIYNRLFMHHALLPQTLTGKDHEHLKKTIIEQQSKISTFKQK